MSLQGQNIVIVGGSSGIGFETARLALQQGANVIIAGRSEEKLSKAKFHLIGNVRTVIANIVNEAAVKQIFTGLHQVNHVFIPAGGLTTGNILETAPNAFRQGLEERIFGALYVIREAVPRMSTGSITLMSGKLADRPTPGTTMTTVGVSAVEALTRSLSLELAPIRVNAIAPGWTDTPLVSNILGTQYETVIQTVIDKIPVKRIGTPEEVAQVAILLMSNGFINGEILHIDGGERLV
ncbi:SDR family oxidoreductase [Nostocaceae cyanobacterium CENA357]|uniref:SDR family oxidoreductase n=1 Tax=Atlanticothrix silvestris CENA357 TaxID=1725252 RepID=A0A8J7L236_9CYAN|nr:SDR family oxidoreductase [Atlanticothrix silvestris]MBH8552879.1 SDR family oxidoreductase [Atlanticothrix silvestris CENA357]